MSQEQRDDKVGASLIYRLHNWRNEQHGHGVGDIVEDAQELMSEAAEALAAQSAGGALSEADKRCEAAGGPGWTARVQEWWRDNGPAHWEPMDLHQRFAATAKLLTSMELELRAQSATLSIEDAERIAREVLSEWTDPFSAESIGNSIAQRLKRNSADSGSAKP